MNKKLRQTLSLLMSTTMIGMQSGVSIYAKENNSKLCEHHLEHTEWCHYMEELGEESCDYECEYCEITDVDKDLESKIENDLVEDMNVEEPNTEEENNLPEDSLINQENGNMILEDEIASYAAAVDPQVVYTEATKSNLDQSGNGSKSNPYNRFEDAIANVADGGTIIIKSGKGAFLNTQDEYGQIPFIINKDVTIQSETEGSMADLTVRAGGIVLEGDVTFKNINFQFANKVHDSIFANGYKLEIIDSERGPGSRQVDLFAGSLYEKNTNDLIQGYVYDENGNRELVTPKVGTNASILLKTTDKSIHSEFGKVFAGSMNGDFKGNVNIEIKDNGDLDIVSVHSSGAEEAKPGSMFDFEEPAPPEEKPDDYTVDGTVKINLENYRTNVDGAGATEAHVTFNTQYPINNLEVKDITSMTIEGGRLIPDSITFKNGEGDLIISEPNAELDLTNIKDLTINNFTGGGKITSAREGHLTIQGDITGETTFQVAGGPMDGSTSGPAINDHTYITSQANNGDDKSFEFIPHVLQPGYKLEKLGNEWKIVSDSNQATLPDKLTSLEFINDEATIEVIDVDPDSDKTYWGSAEFEFNLKPELGDSALIDDLPFEVSISGKKATKDQGNNIWIVDEYGLQAEIFDSGNYVLSILPYIDASGLSKSFTSGTYDVELSLPDYNVSDNAVLYVKAEKDTSVDQPENSKTQITLKVDNQVIDENTPVTFTNKLNVTAGIQKNPNSPAPFAVQNEVDLIVNGKVIESTEVNNQTASFTVGVTTDNGFKDGVNEIKVLFGGSDTLTGSTASQTLKVKKVKPDIKLSPNIQKVYDGKPHALTATVTNVTNTTPTISYYKNPDYTGTSTTLSPTDAGTYYAEVSIPENDMYEGITLQQGTITITKATPSLVLSGEVINNTNATNDLKVYATMRFPESGRIPAGQIEFTCTNGQYKKVATANLIHGASNYTFKGLPEGKYTITANYIPKIEGIIDENYNEVKGIQETFEVLNDFVSIQNVDLESSELELSLNDTGKTLNYQIKPDNATNQDVVWESSNPNIISIDPKTGKIEVKGEGSVFITIRTKGGNYSDSLQLKVVGNASNREPVQSITFDQNNLKLDLNGTKTQKLKASIAPHNATNQNISWKSQDDTIATVDDDGNVIAKSVGRTKIMAITQDGGKTAVCEVQVIDSHQPNILVTDIIIQEGNLTLEQGQRKMIIPTIAPVTASDKGIEWESSNLDVAEVTETGTIIAKSAGTATITATAKDGSDVTTSMTVTVTKGGNPPTEIEVTGVTLDKNELSLTKGESHTLKATLTPTDASNKNVEWKSDNEAIATVTADGKVIAKSAGTVTITVTALGNKNITATCTVIVTDDLSPEVVPVTGVKLDREKVRLSKGGKDTLTAIIEPQNATHKDVTWKSANPSIVSVDEYGNITAHSKGETKITVTTKEGGFTATAKITVDSSGGSNTNNNNNSNTNTNNNNNSNTNNNNNNSNTETEKESVTIKPDTNENQSKPSVEVSQFKDVSNHWAKDDVAFVVEKGLFYGLSETEFGINEPMTRGMIVTVLHRLADSPQVNSIPFLDVKAGAFYANAVAWANATGITSGVSKTEFAPNDNVTREQLAVMLYQYATSIGLVTEATITQDTQFKDADQISKWSEEAMKWAVDKGILLGTADGTLDPQGIATRAQVATVIKRFVGVIKG